MTDYAFRTLWRADAPIERVYGAIEDAEAWPAWWPGVRRVERLADGDADGVGTRYRFEFRSRLPYSLVFDVRVAQVQRPTRLVGEASGELAGIGTWTLQAADDGWTDVRYDWNVRTTRWWMNLLAPLARLAFVRNHDVIMEWGRIGLGRRLGASVEADSPA